MIALRKKIKEVHIPNKENNFDKLLLGTRKYKLVDFVSLLVKEYTLPLCNWHAM